MHQNITSLAQQKKRDKALGQARQRSDFLFKFNGLEILVGEGVFPPDLGLTSLALARIIPQYTDALTALDMGCGTGLLALTMRQCDIPVVWAVDSQMSAVRCALKNVLHYNSDLSPIYVRQSDLFARIPNGLKFDLIAFNQPYYPATTDNIIFGLDKDGGKVVIERFLESAKQYLKDNGKVLMPYSTLAGAKNNPSHIAAAQGWQVKTVWQEDSKGQAHHIYELSNPPI